MPEALLHLIYALAVARVTGLITADAIFDGVRRAALQALVGTEERPRTGLLREKTAYLLTCQWCASLWVAAVAAPVWYFWGDHPLVLVPAAALAMSQVTGMLSDLGRE